MNWKILAVLICLYQYGLVSILIKKIGASEGSRARKLVWQYFFCAFLAITTAMVAKQITLSISLVAIAFIGMAVACGAYCHWRAFAVSMSRTAMLSILDDLIAMTLGYAILGELRILTPALTIGVIIVVTSGILFAKAQHEYKLGGGKLGNQYAIWVFCYTIFGGVAMFSTRFFSLQGMPILTYVAAYYFGAWLAALLLRFLVMGPDEIGRPLTNSQRVKVLLLGTSLWISLMLSYFIRIFVPITVIQPISLVAEMSIPTMIGLVIFHEGKGLSARGVGLILIGFIGISLIAVGF